MATITAPNGEQMPDTSNPGLLAYYERHGYTIDAGDPESDAPVEAPAQSAHKAEWVAWAVAHGASQTDAEEMTKAELIDQFDTPEPNGE